MSALRVIVMIMLVAALSGCGKGRGDLERYVAEVKARKPAPIEPLPEIKPYETFIYDADELRDPFSSGFDVDSAETVGSVASSGPRPDPNRRREELESYPLDSLDMVGTFERIPDWWALIKDPEGRLHRVRTNNYLGQNHGRITEIKEDRVEVLELVPDGLGGWMERRSAIALDEGA